MSKMPVLRPSQLVAVLKRKGFRADRQRGSHLFLINDTTGRKTAVPMHARDLKPGTLHGILSQAGISRDELLRLLK